MLVRSASTAWKLLDGIFCLCKPKEMTTAALLKLVVNNLCRDLNEMDSRPLNVYQRPVYRENAETLQLEVVKRVPQIDYSEHPLVVGKGYLPADFNVQSVDNIDYWHSGVLVVGANDACHGPLERLRRARLLRVYHVDGLLGRATVDQTTRGKVLERSTYDHVTMHRMNSSLARFVAGSLQAVYSYAGVDLQSQRAFQLASRGLVRPSEQSPAVFYSIKCLQLRRPFFKLEVQCINESDRCLLSLVHALGLSLKSTAACASIKRIRDGPFDLQLALLLKHCTLENVVNNIGACRQLVQQTGRSGSRLHLTPVDSAPAERIAGDHHVKGWGDDSQQTEVVVAKNNDRHADFPVEEEDYSSRHG